MNKITAIIPFASYDEQFFKLCIDKLLACDIKVVVVAYDHLYSGEKEDMVKLQKCFDIFKDNPMVCCNILNWAHIFSTLYLEAYSRYFGMLYAKRYFNPEYLLFIDIDEIVEPVKFTEWLCTGKYKKYKGIKLRCYMYSILSEYRLRGKFYNTVMCSLEYAISLGFKIDARLQYVNNKNRLSRWLSKLGMNPYFLFYSGKPFIHHYTSVRSKENMIKKVTNWSHNKDRNDWVNVIENEFKVKDGKIGKDKFDVVYDIFNIKIK